MEEEDGLGELDTSHYAIIIEQILFAGKEGEKRRLQFSMPTLRLAISGTVDQI